jgi:aspartyl-tRNA(Asn)/glutamyl-tRNA(Gln) amidotransferase subunit C
MKISKEEILHVADLARLDIDEAAVATFASQIDEILEYIDSMNRVDTEDIPATTHAIFLSNAFRQDEPGNHLDCDTALSNAPEKENGCFTVPKIIG